MARRQDALSWELRVATSLAYDRFTEGFGTAEDGHARAAALDLRAAKTLLSSFG